MRHSKIMQKLLLEARFIILRNTAENKKVVQQMINFTLQVDIIYNTEI